MKTIHKQTLDIVDKLIIHLHEGDVILKVAEQDGQLCIWYSTSMWEGKPSMPKEIHVRGTGHEINPESLLDHYFDTVVMSDGFVWHIFIKDV